MSEPRRFPAPWSVEERPACFIVHDANGQRSGISTTRKNLDGAAPPTC
jgi:hypothetical protein